MQPFTSFTTRVFGGRPPKLGPAELAPMGAKLCLL